MAMNLGAVNVNLVANTSKFVKGMSNARKALQQTGQSAKDQNEILKKNAKRLLELQEREEVLGKTRKKLSADLKALVDREAASRKKAAAAIAAVEKEVAAALQNKKLMIKGNAAELRKLHKEQKKGSKKYKDLLAQNEAAVKRLRRARSGRKGNIAAAHARESKEIKKVVRDYNRLAPTMARYNNTVRKVSRSQDELRESTDKASKKTRTFGKSLKSIGVAGMAAAAAGIYAIARAADFLGGQLLDSSKKASRFEHQLKKLEAVTSASSAEMFELNNKALQMSRKFGVAADKVADGMSFMGMAGMKASEILTGIESVMKLSTIGMMEFSRAADIATNIMTQWGVPAEALTDVVDVMAATITSSNTNMVQMGDAMKYVAPIAKASGVSIEETSAAIGLLGNAGIQGEMAGTALRNALSRLQNPSKKSAKLLKALGVTVVDSAGKMRPFIDIMYDFESAGMTADEALQIFGQRAGPAMVSILEQGISSLDAYAFSLNHVGGVAEDISNNILASFQSRLKKIHEAVNRFKIVVGEELNNALVSVGETILKSFGGAEEAIDALRKATRELIVDLVRYSAVGIKAYQAYQKSQDEMGGFGYIGFVRLVSQAKALGAALEEMDNPEVVKNMREMHAAQDLNRLVAESTAARVRELKEEYSKMPAAVVSAIATFEHLGAAQSDSMHVMNAIVDALRREADGITSMKDAAKVAQGAMERMGLSFLVSGEHLKDLLKQVGGSSPKLRGFLRDLYGQMYASTANIKPADPNARRKREKDKKATDLKKAQKDAEKQAKGIASRVAKNAKRNTKALSAEYKQALATLKLRVKMFKAQGKAEDMSLHQNEALIAVKSNLIQMEYLMAQTAAALGDEKAQIAAQEQKSAKLSLLQYQIQQSRNKAVEEQLKKEAELLKLQQEQRREQAAALAEVMGRFKDAFDSSIIDEQAAFMEEQTQRQKALNDEETRSAELAKMHNESLKDQIELYDGIVTALSETAKGYIEVADSIQDMADATTDAAHAQAALETATNSASAATAIQSGIFDLLAEQFGGSPAEKQQIKGAGGIWTGLGEAVTGAIYGATSGDVMGGITMGASGLEKAFAGATDIYEGSLAEDVRDPSAITSPEGTRKREREKEDTTKAIVDALKEAGLYRPDVREQTLQFFGSDVLSLQQGRNSEARRQRVLQEVNLRDRF